MNFMELTDDSHEDCVDSEIHYSAINVFIKVTISLMQPLVKMAEKSYYPDLNSASKMK